MIRKKFLSIFACVFVLIAFASLNAKAQDIHVPYDYTTIQAAINAASANSGGRVLVYPEHYNALAGESFPIILPSGVALINAGPGVCVLDAKGSSSVISCMGDSSSRVEGFFIINGGGGVGCWNNLRSRLFSRNCQ